MIGRSGERGSGISVLAAQHDDDDDDSHMLEQFVLPQVLELGRHRCSPDVETTTTLYTHSWVDTWNLSL